MRRFAPVAALFLLALPAMAARQVALVIDGELAQPARHGLAKLQEALRAKGFDVTASAAQADYVILAGTGASAALQQWKAPAPAGRDLIKRPPRRRHRGDQAEQLFLVRHHPEIADHLAAVSDRAGQVRRHLAAVVNQQPR